MIDDTPTDAVDETVEVTDEATEVADTVEGAEGPAAPASLDIQDLAQLRNIINVASQRGAFKPEEFSVVGATYTKLNDFITSVTAQSALAKESASDTDAVTEEVVTEE